MYIRKSEELDAEYPDLNARLTTIKNVNVERSKPELEDFKKVVYQKIRDRWNIEELKNHDLFKKYRTFFWSLGIDPTKIRPASEALIRRILRGREIPKINTLVDTYNLASIVSGIPLAAFDNTKLQDELLMRKAEPNKVFLGIGMEKPVSLKGNEIIIQDTENIIAIYPYRDADYSKIMPSTKEVLLMTCGAPGITVQELTEAESTAVKYITRFCNGISAYA
jgi:DNA/RNA-binding domain of Phe-tRNA-synthetase-like protein